MFLKQIAEVKCMYIQYWRIFKYEESLSNQKDLFPYRRRKQKKKTSKWKILSASIVWLFL